MSTANDLAAPAPLRVAIIAGERHAPRYAIDALRKAVSQPGIEFVGIYFPAPMLAVDWTHHLFAGIEMLEDWLGRLRGRQEAEFTRADIAGALGAPRASPLQFEIHAGRLIPDATALAQLRAENLDVVLCCTQAPLTIPPGVVRHGVLGIEVGYDVPAHAPWAGAAELGQGSPLMVTRLVDYAAPGTAEIYVACDKVVPTSLRRNRRNAIAKGSTVMRRLLQSMAAGGRRDSVPRLQDLPPGYPRAPDPSLGLLVQASRRIGRRLLNNRLQGEADYNLWHLAYAFSDTALPEVAFDRLRYLAPAPGTFWADPFPLRHEGRHYILFEELHYASRRGRLLAVEVAEDRPASAPLTVLERDYHMSYPQAFHWNGELYMVPETRQAQRVELLRCVEFPSRWELVKVLLDGVRAVDATLWQQGGSWWLFANVALDGCDTADELHLYFADSLFGEWTPHPANPLCADVRCARPAGPLFVADGQTFRPSQDGALGYGAALWINRIERLDRTGYREQSVRRIAPDWHPDVSRVHTLGRAGRLTVLDCVVKDRGTLDIQPVA